MSKGKKFKVKFVSDGYVNKVLTFNKGETYSLEESSARRWFVRGHLDVSKSGEKLLDHDEKQKIEEEARADKLREDREQKEKDRLAKAEEDKLAEDEKRHKEEAEKRNSLCNEYFELTGKSLTIEEASDLVKLEGCVEDERVKANAEANKSKES